MTTQQDIREWIERAPEGSTHMLVVCDTFDYEDYPVYVYKGEDARIIEVKHNGMDMQKVMEVYNLKMPIEPQIKETRARNY